MKLHQRRPPNVRQRSVAGMTMLTTARDGVNVKSELSLQQPAPAIKSLHYRSRLSSILHHSPISLHLAVETVVFTWPLILVYAHDASVFRFVQGASGTCSRRALTSRHLFVTAVREGVRHHTSRQPSRMSSLRSRYRAMGQTRASTPSSAATHSVYRASSTSTDNAMSPSAS